MLASTIATAAIMAASVYADSVGSAHVVNECSYDVYLSNVPSSGGGFETSDETLKAGQSWTQPWTQLSNGNGWSIKLSRADNLNNILQYEYTWQNDGTIWYDLSCVNGNPWDGNWEITADGDDCTPRQAAYRYSTDDAYGMQSCGQGSSITVTLCSGESADNSTSSAIPVSYSAPASSAPASSQAPASSAAPVSATSSAPISTTSAAKPAYISKAALAVTPASSNTPTTSSAPLPTTFATQYGSPANAVAVDGDGGVFVAVETDWVTEYVTQWVKPKRHEHHPHHRHA